MKRIWAVLAVVLAAYTLSGCSSSGGKGAGPSDPAKSTRLAAFSSCEEMAGEIREAMIARMEAELDGMRSRCRCVDLSGHCGEQPISFVSEESGAVAGGATRTNLQEPGVDEADLVKTDGTHVYAIVGGEVRVVRVKPFESFGRVSSILPQGTPSGLYLNGTRLVVISTKSSSEVPGCIGCASPNEESITEQVYDVSNPSTPLLVGTQSIGGTLVDSRMHGTKLNMVVRNAAVAPELKSWIDFPEANLPECPASGDSVPTREMIDAIEKTKEANRARIAALSIEEMLPKADDVKRHDCTTAHRSRASMGTEILTIVTSDLSDAAGALTALSIVGEGGTLYASTGSLYVAGSKNLWMADEKTLVHRFALVSGFPRYSGTGEVEGVLVDNGFAGSRYSGRFSISQFAMSEREGFLRVATTCSNGAAGGIGSDSRVTVLDITKEALDEVGVVAGMGAGERIRSVRFIGTKAYVVTFRQMDPLYVVDLSEPRAPKISGELKIPGFSTYLHPLDDSHLIGLGFEMEEDGPFVWTKGLKLSLFDVSDPEKPVEVGHRVIGNRGSYSPAVEEHHAFTMDAGGRIALPVDLYKGEGGTGPYGDLDYAGVMLVKADLTGAFADLGAIRIYEDEPEDASWCYLSSRILRTIIVDGGSAGGIVTLTTEGVRLNLIDPAMTAVGGVE